MKMRIRISQFMHVLQVTLLAASLPVYVLFHGSPFDEERQIDFTPSDRASPASVPITTTTSDFQHETPSAPVCSDPMDPASIDFTLVTQLSQDRLWLMKHHCERWGAHAMSIVVLSSGDTRTIPKELQNMGCNLDHIRLQVVDRSHFSNPDTDYPINVLRNMALGNVQTSHVLYVDVDFLVSDGLYELLLSQRDTLATSHKLALVIPAFSFSKFEPRGRFRRAPTMPQSRNDILNQKDKITPFRSTLYSYSHSSTRYHEWLTTQQAGDLIEINCIHSNAYEPYVVFQYCRDTPPFQEQFTGYGKNKVSWFVHLRRMGWTLQQLGGAFVVHYPHRFSPSRQQWSSHKLGSMQLHKKEWLASKRGQVDATFEQFQMWLHTNVPDQSVVPDCPKQQRKQ